MTSSELVEILNSNPGATVCVEAPWSEITSKIKVDFQPADKYCRYVDAVVISAKDEMEPEP